MNNEKDLIKWEKSAKLDEKDMKILKILDKHARYSIAEISKKTGIQRDSVIYRIKKMEEKSVIRFYHAVLNPSALGYEIYADVNFVLHNLTPEKEEKLLDYLISHKNIVYVAKVTGKWDLVTYTIAKNLKEFDEILTEIRMRFSGIIKEYETASILQEYKYAQI